MCCAFSLGVGVGVDGSERYDGTFDVAEEAEMLAGLETHCLVSLAVSLRRVVLR